MPADPLQQVDRVFVRWRGRRLLYFAGCDYFRLASHPQVLRAVAQGARRFGLNVAASRNTTGNHPVYEALEAELAAFFACESAVLLSSGYAGPLAVAQALGESATHVFLDERAHSSPRDAAEWLNAPVTHFTHRDAADLARRLQRLPASARPLVITDGMFAHDGSLAPLPDYLRALPKKGWLLVDDAHGAGTLGARGRGTPEVLGIKDPRLIQTISLSKALGVYGGAVLGPRRLVAALQERSRLFGGNTPLPLPLAHAARTSLRLLKKVPGLRQRLQRNITHAKTTLRAAGISFPDNDSPLLAITPSSPAGARALSRRLLQAGIFPPLIRYAGGPTGGYFRLALSSEHTLGQLDQLTSVLVAGGQRGWILPTP